MKKRGVNIEVESLAPPKYARPSLYFDEESETGRNVGQNNLRHPTHEQ